MVERVLGNTCRHLRAETTRAHRFVYDYRPSGLSDRLEHGVHIERYQRLELYDLDFYSLSSRHLGRFAADLHHTAVTDQGGPISLSHEPRST